MKCAAKCADRYRRLRHTDNIQPRGVNMDVRVNQAGHQETAAAINHLSAVPGRTRGHLADHVPFDDDVHIVAQFFRFAVENAGGLKDNFPGHWVPAHTICLWQ